MQISQPNNTSYSNVFIVGSTGTVGQHVTRAFLMDHPHVHVQILVREESQDKVQEFQQLGARIVVGDLQTISEQELVQLLQGVDVVVSTVSGTLQVTWDGQLKLLNASLKAKVKKCIPSSFGANYEKLEYLYGELILNNPKKQISEALVKSGLEYVLIHTGFFYPYAAMPGFLLDYDPDNHLVRYVHDMNTRIQMIDLEDAGRMTAEAALRKDIKNRSVIIKGDDLTIQEQAQQVFGSDVKFQQGSTLSELKIKLINGRV
ncbi:hypothetical protein C9374_011013 [Naegleria lovaniensis]|uniref:NmrA-like domain-containing protein n=1 Tax=Naegleria lovaniensis TaxID=51637 RepID=A0AA88GHE9_NAELO|nr:uncharacterized protein C9374_011013 [Naegleria lovaniensis]KAG2374176.1 hypothetical protein C9374_011013 [Naegleria lovaniensis]